MALEKSIVVDKIEVVETQNNYPVVLVRTKTVISEDGTEISSSFSRNSYLPDVDTTGLNSRVAAICNATFTDEHRAALTVQQTENGA